MGKSNSYYMQLHVEALFTMNEKNELMTIREPWDSTSQPAPRFYLTRPLYEKPHAYFRADVPKELREKLQSITNREPVLMLPNESPIYDKEYRQLLGESKISEDVPFCAAYLEDSQVVSICRSVRIILEAEEAGIETAELYRRKGYAFHTLAEWAEAVRRNGSIPLYSASTSNLASLGLAKKAGGIFFGNGFCVC